MQFQKDHPLSGFGKEDQIADDRGTRASATQRLNACPSPSRGVALRRPPGQCGGDGQVRLQWQGGASEQMARISGVVTNQRAGAVFGESRGGSKDRNGRRVGKRSSLVPELLST